MMGFPEIPFRLCDFWSIDSERWENGSFHVTGTLPGGGRALAVFNRQAQPKGSWTAKALTSIE